MLKNDLKVLTQNLDIRVRNVLEMNAKCREFKKGDRQNAPKRCSLISLMIEKFVENEFNEEVLETFNQMQQLTMKPNPFLENYLSKIIRELWDRLSTCIKTECMGKSC